MAQDLHRAAQMHGAQGAGIATGFSQMTIEIRQPQAGTLTVGEALTRDRIAQTPPSDGHQVRAGVVCAANAGVKPANVFDKAVPQWQSAIADGDESGRLFYEAFIDARMIPIRPQIRDVVLDQFAQRIVDLPDHDKLAAFRSILMQDGGVGVMRKAWTKIGISQFPETDRGSVTALLREHDIAQSAGAGMATIANQGVRGARSLSVTPVLTDGDLVETFVKAWGEAIDSQGEPDGWGRFLTEGGTVFFGGEDLQTLLATLAKNIHRLPEDRRFTGMQYILEDKSGLGVAAIKSVVSDRGLETVEVFAVADRAAALDLYYKHGIIQLR
ncbi:hypothetical protein DBA20_01120 [Pandoraea capi]|nr:hypothetical protein [Pandoraea sp. LA3]MDN4581587.1 hypothetical protein [Pandoraea capi]